MIFIFNYCYIVYLLLRSVNLLSFFCETYIFIFIYYGVIKNLYNLFSFQMTNHRKYRFHQTDTEQYRYRHQTKVRYRFRFSQKTGTDTGIGEPYIQWCPLYAYTCSLILLHNFLFISSPFSSKFMSFWYVAKKYLLKPTKKISLSIFYFFLSIFSYIYPFPLTLAVT